MLKTLPKILLTIFLLIFLLQLAGLIFLLAVPETSFAKVDKLDLQVNIGETKEITFKGSTASIAEYVRAIYKYAIGIVGILAAVVLMFGGVLWLTAGGNAERVTNAKSWIGAALTGLVLALCSYMILAMINPGLVDFRITDISSVKGTGCCEKIKNSDTGGNTTQDNCESGKWKGEDYNWTGSECKEDLKCDSDKITYNLICLSTTSGAEYELLGYDCMSSTAPECDGKSETCSGNTAKFCCSNAPCTK